MKLLTISNLYPRPDQPQRGLFNAQLFSAMAEQVRSQNPVSSILNICLVPEWRLWRWPGIERWEGERKLEPQMDAGGRRCGEDQENVSIQTRYFPVFYFPLVGRSLSWWTYLQGLKQLKKLVLDCDAVLSTWLYPDAVAATFMAAECRKPAWVMVQGSDTFHMENPARRRVILEACSKAKGIICVCKALAQKMVAAGVDSSKVHVVPNGVDGELFKFRTREDAVRQLSVSSKQLSVDSSWLSDNKEQITNNQYRIVLFVGNLVPVKGADLLLEAWCCLMKRRYSHPPILLFIGSGPMRKQLETQAGDLGINDSVRFLGSLPHEEVALWMNVADCLCLPSRSEGLPNVIIEALASGLQVVATDVGGVSELIAGDADCRLVVVESQEKSRSKSYAKLAEAVAGVLDAEVDRKAMAERNRDRFSWKKQAGTILSLIGSR